MCYLVAPIRAKDPKSVASKSTLLSKVIKGIFHIPFTWHKR